MDNTTEIILKKLESKKSDCIAFSKKNKDRGNDDLYQYYEGALWAINYSIKLISEESNC